MARHAESPQTIRAETTIPSGSANGDAGARDLVGAQFSVRGDVVQEVRHRPVLEDREGLRGLDDRRRPVSRVDGGAAKRRGRLFPHRAEAEPERAGRALPLPQRQDQAEMSAPRSGREVPRPLLGDAVEIRDRIVRGNIHLVRRGEPFLPAANGGEPVSHEDPLPLPRLGERKVRHPPAGRLRGDDRPGEPPRRAGRTFRAASPRRAAARSPAVRRRRGTLVEEGAFRTSLRRMAPHSYPRRESSSSSIPK